MEHAAHKAFLCSGEPWPAHGGSWIGHVLPGVFLLAWGLHWFISASYQHLTGVRKQPAGAAHHKIVFLPGALQDIEPLLKVILPAIAITLEFSLSGTRYLRCPSGTAKAGELDIQHMNSWSHATNYPPLLLSGLVDLVHTHWAPLPHGVTHFCLASAFGTSAFLMLAHTKADPLDSLVHQLLGYCMVAVALAVGAQGAVLGNSQGFALNAAKSLALMMEGCWFLAITHIMFSSDTTWGVSHQGDMTPTIFTPVLFAWIFTGVITFLLLLYLAMHTVLLGQHGSQLLLLNRQHPGKSLPNSSTGAGGIAVGGSCGDWRGRKPWMYLKLSQQQEQQHSEVDPPAGTASDTSCEGGTGSDTSIEMV